MNLIERVSNSFHTNRAVSDLHLRQMVLQWVSPKVEPRNAESGSNPYAGASSKLAIHKGTVGSWLPEIW